ncbi:MAG: PAS domain S-box protein [Thermodesulfobacteriota bacterium]
MTHEEIRQMIHEMQVSRIEAELENEQLRKKIGNGVFQSEIVTALTETMLDIVAMTDLEGNFLFAGKSHEILGYDPAFLVGKNVMDFVHPEDLPKLRKAFDEFIASAGMRKTEYRYLCQDGSYLWLETAGNFLKDPDGIPQKIVFSSRDITERKQMEEALRKSEKKFRHLFEKAEEGILIVRGETIEFANPALQKILGYPVDTITSQPFATFIHPEDRETMRKLHVEMMQSEFREKRHDFRVITYDGTVKWINIHGQVIDWDGTPANLSFVTDITERKHAEEELVKNQQLLEGIIDGIDDVLAIQLPDHSIVRYNQAGYDLLGITPEEAAGKKCYELIGRYHECVECATRKALQSGKQEKTEKYVPEIETYLDCRSNPICDEHGNVVQIVEHLRDITARKEQEKQLRESEQRFRQWFESSPISLWEEDFSAIKKRLDEIKARNGGDLDSYFRQRPELVWELAKLVRVLDVNQATLKLYRANSKEDFFNDITKVFSRESLEGFLPILEVIAAGEKEFVTEKEHVALDGEPLKVQLYWAVAKGHEKTYSRILVSIVDITQRKRAEQALRQSENYYRAIFETSATAIFILEEDTTISHVNSNFEKLLGYSKQEVEGKKSWTELIHTGDVEWMKKNHYLRRRDPRAAPLSYEFRFFVRSGELRHGYLTIDMIAGTSQSVVSLMDITERKQAEETVEKERTYLSTVIDNIGEAIVICDADGRITRFNETARRLHGLPEQPIPPDQWARHYDLYQEDGITPLPMEEIPLFRALQGERVQNAEIVAAPKHSRPYFLVCNGQALTDETGKIKGAVAAMHDITERKRMEQALRRERDLNQRYLNTTQTMMVALDAEGRVIMINRSGRELLGYAEDEILGSNWFETCLPQPEGMEFVYPVFRRILAGDRPSSEYFENNVVCRDGTQRLMGWHSAFLEDDDGRVVGTLSSGEDITERKQAEEALRKSEEKFRHLFEKAGEGILIVRGETIEFASPALENILEYPIDRITSEPFVTFIHPDDRETVRDLHLRMMQEEFLEKRYDFRIVASDGTVKWVAIHARVIEWDGEPANLSFVTEITEHKRAEEALRRSENYYRAIFETSGSAMFIIEENTIISNVNSNFEALLGYSRQQVEGKKSWTEFVHPDDVEWMKKKHYLQRRDPRLVALNYEFRFFVRSGELRHGYLTVDMIAGTSQSVVSLMDITDRKLAEQQLKESEERFSKAFRSSPAPQVISDIATGEFIDVNDRWVEMLGYTREQSIGRTSKEVGIWADPGERDHIIQKLQKNTFFNEEPVEFRTSQGSTVYALWSAETITLKGRHVMLSMIYDETERKQAEKERERLQAQLAQAQKMESVGRLAGGVAHDFNNKLSIINGYAEMSFDMLDPQEPVYENLNEIYTAGKRSAEIVRQLLAFARQQTISPVQLDLNDTISNMLKMLQRLIGENIDLVWLPGSNLWQVKIDPSQIDQIMANLAVNARDAISDVGRLSIETRNVVVDEDYCRRYSGFVPGKYVLLSVSDNGCGMEKQVQENLFEPFFTTKKVGRGTGLGLSTIYGIVKQNKGFINVYSEPGQGTVFQIYFPPHEKQTLSAPQYPEDTTKPMPTGSETVLLVEDEPAILDMGRGMLEKLGYTVLTAEKPDNALQIAEEYDDQIHLLITDVVMPEMNGRDLAEKLSDCSPGLKLIYMSGYTADVIAHHGVLDEGVQFIQKPFSMRELAAKVREVIERE